MTVLWAAVHRKTGAIVEARSNRFEMWAAARRYDRPRRFRVERISARRLKR